MAEPLSTSTGGRSSSTSLPGSRRRPVSAAMRAVTRRTSSAAAAWSPACRQCTATDTVQVGRSLNSLGDAYRYMRNWDAAENCFKRSLEILEEAHHPRQVAIAKRSMSTIHRQRGQFKEAEQLCLEATAILEGEEMRDERWIAATKLSLADIYLDSGSRDARGLLEECLQIFEKLKDTHWLILTRRSLGEALREDDEYDAAMTQLEMALTVLRGTEDDHWEGQILHSMGRVYLDQQHHERARALFSQAPPPTWIVMGAGSHVYDVPRGSALCRISQALPRKRRPSASAAVGKVGIARRGLNLGW
jgi:tetratricopeptide (TPR) repeat protein